MERLDGFIPFLKIAVFWCGRLVVVFSVWRGFVVFCCGFIVSFVVYFAMLLKAQILPLWGVLWCGVLLVVGVDSCRFWGVFGACGRSKMLVYMDGLKDGKRDGMRSRGTNKRGQAVK